MKEEIGLKKMIFSISLIIFNFFYSLIMGGVSVLLMLLIIYGTAYGLGEGHAESGQLTGEISIIFFTDLLPTILLASVSITFFVMAAIYVIRGRTKKMIAILSISLFISLLSLFLLNPLFKNAIDSHLSYGPVYYGFMHLILPLQIIFLIMVLKNGRSKQETIG